jgi:nitronate monooxygenase
MPAMTTLNALLGTTLPLVQAPMAGVQGAALAAAVCNAGGLGSLPGAMLTPEALQRELSALCAGTPHPWSVNFFCHTPPVPDTAREARWRDALAPFYAEAGLDISAVPAGAGRVPFSHAVADVIEPFRPPVVSFHFGLPAPDLLARVKSWGSVVLSSATTVEEARWLEAHGADAVIAQGLEAGGHRGTFLNPHTPPLRGSLPPEGADPAWGGPAPDLLTSQMGTFALLPQIVSTVRVPVIAAGGIADAAGVAAAMALGAAGVQVGTAYLCSAEATTSALHRAALQSEAARHTALTNVFTGRPARGIVNRAMRELGPMRLAAPAFPLATAAVAPLRAHFEALGHGDFSPLWAGQNASGCRSLPAAEITHQLAQGFESMAPTLHRLRGSLPPEGDAIQAGGGPALESRFVVIFRATARALDADYSAMAAHMRELALTQFGCLDFSAATEGDQEIAVSYWPDEASIRAWKQHTDHLAAQRLGRERWYASYTVDIAEVTRHYSHPAT